MIDHAILIAFEASQTICMAFRNAGFNAFSNDIKDCYGGHHEYHLKMDAVKAIKSRKWNLIIFHPMCTAMAVSGNHVYAINKPKFNERLNAVKYTQIVWDLAVSVCNHVAMENPVGVLNSYGNFPKPQYIQPYEFGHCESKKTGLWLHGLPKLKGTNRVYGRYVNGLERFNNQTDSGQNKLSPSSNRATLRSKTYQGIADAIVEQWSQVIISISLIYINLNI